MREQRGEGLTGEDGIFSLTQIRHLMRIEFTRAQRYGYPVACLALACDRLGHLSDLHGYPFREQVLTHLTGVLEEETRACDFLGRLADDRFMAILPHTEPSGAELTAKRLLSAVKSAPEAPCPSSGDAPGTVTISAGISFFDGKNTMFFDELIEAALEALETAAADGGDSFHLKPPGGEAPRGA